MPKPTDSVRAFAAAAARAKDQPYALRLFVAGTSPASLRAVASVREICDEYLAGRYQLDVVDVYQQPSVARDDQIVAVPTLVKRSPLPTRKILGDLTDKARVLACLDLEPKP